MPPPCPLCLCGERPTRHTQAASKRALLLLCLVSAATVFASCSKSAQTRVATEQRAGWTPPQQLQPTAPPSTAWREEHVLKVCADPNNLPFSNERGEGFENKIAELVAKDLGARVEYTWWAQRRGFIRNTLKSGACDVVFGLPSGSELALTTAPYYRSTYVFVSRKGSKLGVTSFDDPKLRRLKIGVEMIGDDFANTPPAHALANRGIVENVAGYTVYGDYKQESPPARIVDEVADGKIDLAVVWGPLAGYFAKREKTPLELVPVSPQFDRPFLPFVYDISMGVRRGDQSLRDALEQIIERRRGEMDKILDDYGVPRA